MGRAVNDNVYQAAHGFVVIGTLFPQWGEKRAGKGDLRGGAPSKRRRVCAALLRIVKAVEELLSEERPGDAEVH